MATNTARAATESTVPIGERCVLCGIRLTTDYWIARGICGSCSERAEGKALPRDSSGKAVRPAPRAVQPREPRAFTTADKSLIKHAGRFLAPAQLLETLNARLQADVANAVPYTMTQLQAELETVTTTSTPGDWSDLRRLLAAARKSGVLARISTQTIDDFAIVYRLTGAQKLHLADVLRHAKEGM
jgi:hypothetical protein